MNLWRDFLVNERGQDLIEYTLLMAFVALASSIFISAGGSISGVWANANRQLSAANTGQFTGSS